MRCESGDDGSPVPVARTGRAADSLTRGTDERTSAAQTFRTAAAALRPMCVRRRAGTVIRCAHHSLAGALTVATALVCAAPAAGDSIVYLRDWNVWLANSDGTGQYQVTTDGREALPYLSRRRPTTARSPSRSTTRSSSSDRTAR